MAWISDEVIQVGTFLIAALGLARPEITRGIRKAFKPPLLDIHETGFLEICFSAFGNTICTRGTLRPVNLSLFITSINIEVTRMSDNVRHDFNWFLFREDAIIKNQSQSTDQSTALIAHSFNVYTDQSHFYSIQFMDVSIRDELLRLLANTKKRWDEGVQKLIRSKNSFASPELMQEAYKSFIASKLTLDDFNKLERLFFWEPSIYSAKMIVNCSRPNKVFSKNWKFTISKEDSETLKRNNFPIISAVSNVVPITFNFVFPNYQ